MNQFALIVPTLNPGLGWLDFLNAFSKQSIQPVQAILIDSGSSGTEVGDSFDLGFDVVSISKSDFSHGGTRQMGIDQLSAKCDVVVFLTQDAIFANELALERLLYAFEDAEVSAAYGRQLPHNNAQPLGAHARYFNYGTIPSVRSLDSVPELGFRSCFISNSFAAYRIKDLHAVGGFPLGVILGEDTCVAAKLILAGKKVAYVADACVYHSHDYTMLQEFQRYFDTGVLHAQQPWLLEHFGGATSEGKRFVISEIKYLARHAPCLIPSALLRTFMKLLGYRLGRIYTHLPTWLRVKLSMHKGYWQRKA